jgi:hypothetical protein
MMESKRRKIRDIHNEDETAYLRQMRKDAIEADKKADEIMGRYHKRTEIRKQPLPLVKKPSLKNSLALRRTNWQRLQREYVEAVRACVLLARLVQARDDAKPDGQTILESVAQKHRLRVSDLTSAIRQQHVIPARFEACYEIRRLTTLSLPQIGKLMGGRDHTTVLHSIKMHAQRNGLRRLDGGV